MKNLTIDVPIHLIQEIRLIQALCETGLSVQLPAAEQAKFQELLHTFEFRFAATPAAHPVPYSHAVQLNHQAPQICLADLQKPLVFPQAIVRHCRTLWQARRQHRFAFLGLVTDSRRTMLAQWLMGHQQANWWQQRLFRTKWLNRLVLRGHHRLGRPAVKTKLGSLLLWQSMRGRLFPQKAWDEEYFRVLGNAQFALCPNGDSVWTYRFFEAILCGAIPVVEASCDLYHGFQYYHLHDAAETLSWSAEIAAANYARCVELLTFSPAELTQIRTRFALPETPVLT